METVEKDPAKFHIKNRGIIYGCEKFEVGNAARVIRLTNPAPPEDEDLDDLNGLKYGIADGGHTFEVIQQTSKRAPELQKLEGWTEPFVQVHFLAVDTDALVSGEIEQVVETLKKLSLRAALALQIAFRENEEKDCEVREITQRVGCFLKERWKSTQPTQMYRSKGKALELFTADASSPEFEREFLCRL